MQKVNAVRYQNIDYLRRFRKDQSVSDDAEYFLQVACLYSQSEQPSKGGCHLPKTGENIYKRKDGRWEARFISGRKPDGRAKYTSVYARTYAAAKAKLEDRKRMIVSRPAGSCRLTVKELFVWYLSQAEIKPSTRARYVFLIEHHILPELGSIFVVSLTAKQLSDFLSQKRQSGRLHGGGLSAKSVRDIGVLIKAALRFASAEYHFYCDALNTKLPKAKRREIEPFSAWELDQLRKGLSPSPNHKDAGILLSANGGLRLGEVCALRVSDIDFQNGTVSIEHAVQRVRQNGKTKLIIQTPKSGKSVRVIPLPNDMMAYLKKAVSGLSQNAYILTGRTDKPMEPRTYQYYFESVLRRCGVRKRSYHTLRHTYATRCIENGIDVKSVSEMLGHADVTTTLRLYVHPSMDSKRQAVQKISFLGGVA